MSTDVGKPDLSQAPFKQLGEHSLVYDSKEILNYLQTVISSLVNSSLFIEDSIIGSSDNWNFLPINTLKFYNSLAGGNAPSATAIGSQFGYVITLASVGDSPILIQYAVGTGETASGIAYRGGATDLAGSSWHYLLNDSAQGGLITAVQQALVDANNTMTEQLSNNQVQLNTLQTNFVSNATNLMNNTVSSLITSGTAQLKTSFDALSTTYSGQFDEWQDTLKGYQLDLLTEMKAIDAIIDGNISDEIVNELDKVVLDLKSTVKQVDDALAQLGNLIKPNTITFTQALPDNFLNDY